MTKRRVPIHCPTPYPGQVLPPTREYDPAQPKRRLYPDPIWPKKPLPL